MYNMSIIPDEEFLNLKCQVGVLQDQVHKLQTNCRQAADELNKLKYDTVKKTDTALGIKICLARDSVENWEESTRILLPGELAIAYDSWRNATYLKCGNGVDLWRDLPYISIPF